MKTIGTSNAYQFILQRKRGGGQPKQIASEEDYFAHTYVDRNNGQTKIFCQSFTSGKSFEGVYLGHSFDLED